MVPEAALSHMAAEGMTFTVEGPATYERILKLNQRAGPQANGDEAAPAA